MSLTKITCIVCLKCRACVNGGKSVLLQRNPRAGSKIRHLAMAIRLFEGKEHAKLYAKYRPTFPGAIYDEIIKYCSSGTLPMDLAVDVGCGSGQSTRPLSRYFRKVIGSDVSEQQIQSAIAKTTEEHGNITYHTSPGEDLSFIGDNSVDLITVSQALHWFDHDVFYSEVRRVLKETGVFAAYGYGNNVLNDEEAEKLQLTFYRELLGDYWDKERLHIENHYNNLKFPFDPATRIESDSISIHRQMPVSAYIGYLSTWSAWQKYKDVHKDTTELEELHKKLHAIYSKNSDQEDPTLEVYWPGFLILSRKRA